MLHISIKIIMIKNFIANHELVVGKKCVISQLVIDGTKMKRIHKHIDEHLL